MSEQTAPPRTGLVPIGLDLGTFSVAGRAPYSRVFLRNTELELPDDQYRLWRLSRTTVDGQFHTRASLEQTSSGGGGLIDELLERGMLLELTPMTVQSWEFAIRTNLRPRVVGLGTVVGSDEIAVGVNGYMVDQLPPVVFDVLMWSHLDGNLLDGIRRAALRDPRCSLRLSLETVYICLPELIERGAAYLDHREVHAVHGGSHA